MYALCLFGSLLAVAVWGKMRFVTNLPRMAYAVPEEQAPLAHGEVEAPNDPNAPALNSESEHRSVTTPENVAPQTGGYE